MPRLDNIRHERFAREYIKHGRATDAYRKAGFAADKPGSVWTASSRLLRHVQVASRISELRRQMTYKTKISLESLLSDLAEDRQLARELGQASAAIQATVTAAKLVGLMVDRKESGAPGDFASLSAEQILARVREDHGPTVADALAKAFAAPEQGEAQGDLDTAPAEPGAALN